MKWWRSDGYPTRGGYIVMIVTTLVLAWAMLWRVGDQLAAAATR